MKTIYKTSSDKLFRTENSCTVCPCEYGAIVEFVKDNYIIKNIVMRDDLNILSDRKVNRCLLPKEVISDLDIDILDLGRKLQEGEMNITDFLTQILNDKRAMMSTMHLSLQDKQINSFLYQVFTLNGIKGNLRPVNVTHNGSDISEHFKKFDKYDTGIIDKAYEALTGNLDLSQVTSEVDRIADLKELVDNIMAFEQSIVGRPTEAVSEHQEGM